MASCACSFLTYVSFEPFTVDLSIWAASSYQNLMMMIWQSVVMTSAFNPFRSLTIFWEDIDLLDSPDQLTDVQGVSK